MFFDDNILLYSESAVKIYAAVKDLPIIDYHCHLNPKKIAADAYFADIGELWLGEDHYKWRAMRLCGVDEEYITGGASWHDKFVKYAEIVPLLAGNALYYWTHLELKQIFGIEEPLNGGSAERIYMQANEKLKKISVSTLFVQYKVEYIATTDDPVDDLREHGIYGGISVAPTFRPDKLYGLEERYLQKLGEVAVENIETLEGFKKAIVKRLDYFVSHGCKISDHGFENFPKSYASEEEAAVLYENRARLADEQKDAFFGWLLVWLAKEYARRDMIMQIHFAVVRNNNTAMFKRCGADSGFDLISETPSVKRMISFFDKIADIERPETIVYTLNDATLPALVAVTGAFRKVKAGAAWWFNDTVQGIRKNLATIAEYSVLGTNYGMLTDSRSFSSYARFDFFRRILSDYLGALVEKGEVDEGAAIQTAQNICYYNMKKKLS